MNSTPLWKRKYFTPKWLAADCVVIFVAFGLPAAVAESSQPRLEKPGITVKAAPKVPKVPTVI